ncbi:MAG: heparinase II/III family protein, partial [Candidatus Latescibacteria bacterium]|nr:heparinase II/III family protein [Candidatus Latescibacterota bacterium]
MNHANREWTLVNAVAQRIQRAGLAYLISEQPKYRDDALRQMESLFDTTQWPDWRDKAHPRTEVDLRGGMLSSAIALAYDWMHPLLTETERKSILSGLDERGLQPYFRDIEADAYWADVRTNWLTTILGGLGIAGMALAEDHPRSQELVDFAMPRMIDYLDRYGPEGEFNESVGYSSSTTQPVAFFAAHRYASKGGQNRLAEHPFPQTCHWTIYFTLPPGRYAAFGDGHVDAPPALTFIPAVADATQDGVLQKFYLDYYANLGDARRSLAWELLWYNPDLAPTSLNIPTGRAFHAHGACFSSRADWNPVSTPSLVYGKGGSGTIVHGHHDVGQICIDGYGERLIVDLGSPPGYPADYGANKYEYYNASAHGHNILIFGGREMKHKERAEILDASFEDDKGGTWQTDLTPKYDGAKTARRTVVHLHPEVIAVLDEAELEAEENISLRWHTISPATPDDTGCF